MSHTQIARVSFLVMDIPLPLLHLVSWETSRVRERTVVQAESKTVVARCSGRKGGGGNFYLLKKLKRSPSCVVKGVSTVGPG